MIGVSRITLHRRIRELGLEEETRYNEIDDQELDVFVRTILALLPNSGEVTQFIAQNACKIILHDGGLKKRLRTNPLPSNRPCTFQDCVTTFIY